MAAGTCGLPKGALSQARPEALRPPAFTPKIDESWIAECEQVRADDQEAGLQHS